MFDCSQFNHDTQPELVADNAARLSIDELPVIRPQSLEARKLSSFSS